MRGERRWTAAEIQQLRDLAAEGYTQRRAAEALGRTLRMVETKAQRLSLKFRGNGRKEYPDRGDRDYAEFCKGALQGSRMLLEAISRAHPEFVASSIEAPQSVGEAAFQ